MNYRVEYKKINNLLYKPILFIDNVSELEIPLLLEEYQTDKLNNILKLIKFDNNINYFKMVVVGAVRFSMKF